MATLPTTGDDLDLVSFTVETQPSDTYKPVSYTHLTLPTILQV